MPPRVKVADSVYQVCMAHALMTEHEEVMGLLLGNTAGEDEVHIWHSMTLRRSDKRPDRCEISPEQLAEAASSAEEISGKVGFPTRVVGWYHSHPHITCLPSHVDLRTQMQYQSMDSSFVGLIFAVFNAGPALGTMRHELMGFRAAEGSSLRGELLRVDLAVNIVPLCEALPRIEGKHENSFEALGGSLAQHSMVAAAAHGLAEVKEANAEEMAKQRIPGDELARVQHAAEYWERLCSLTAEEILPLQPLFDDAAHNAKVLTDCARQRCRQAQDWQQVFDEPLSEDEPTLTIGGRDELNAGCVAAACPDRCGWQAGDPPISVDLESQPTQEMVQRGTQPAVATKREKPEYNTGFCLARTFNREKRCFQQCQRRPLKDLYYPDDGKPWEFCGGHSQTTPTGGYQPKLAHGAMDEELDDALESLQQSSRDGALSNEATSVVPRDEAHGGADFDEELEVGRIQFSSARRMYIATRRGPGGERREFSEKEHGEEAYSEAQMWLVCAEGTDDAGSSASTPSRQAEEPARKAPRHS